MRREVIWFFAILWATPLILIADDTELSLYRPLTDTTNHVPLTVVESKRGECHLQSQLIKREDAWRCVAEGKVYDPCFVPRFGSYLEAFCSESPWSHQGVRITVVAPLDNSQHEALDMSQTFPWAVELINGEKCKAIDINEQYDGLPVRYRCDSQATLIGHVQRCENTWKMLQHASNGVDTVQIKKAWF
jgi:hypothetical protein